MYFHTEIIQKSKHRNRTALSLIPWAANLAAIITPIGAHAANPTTGVLLTAADTYLTEAAPDQNHGDADTLYVGPVDEFLYLARALYQFDTSWLPEDATIVSAELNLYLAVTPATDSADLTLHAVESDWGEDTATWNTRPGVTPYSTHEIDNTGGWKAFDVTELIQDIVAGDRFGVLLSAEDGEVAEERMGFYSKEAPLCGPFVEISYLTEETSEGSPQRPECDPATDTEPPAIALTATPNPGTPASPLTVTATVTDNEAIHRIQLMHGGAVLEDRIIEGTADTQQVIHQETYGPGMHRFSVIAWDRNMNGASTSIRVPVHVDGEPPRVTVSHLPLHPEPGERVFIEATADDVSGVESLHIFANGRMHDYRFEENDTHRTASVVIEVPEDARFIRYQAAARDAEGFYASTGTKFILIGGSEGPDSDGDTLSDAIEEALGTNPDSNDTDGDGLYDHWEIMGVDTDGDGMPDLDLPGMGASPHHRDMFVEVDWMEDETISYKPHPATITTMVNLYRDYGVRLHIDTGQLGGGNSIPYEDDPIQCRVCEGGNCEYDCSVCTGKDISPKREWVKLAETKYANFAPNRFGIFYYVLSMHGRCFGPKAMLQGGNVILTAPRTSTAARQIMYFFHELGHAVGLGHGGQTAGTQTLKAMGPEGGLIDVTVNGIPDHENVKPNYLSNMNYRYQWALRFLPEGGDPDLASGDSIFVYSYSHLNNHLDELNLDESNGLDGYTVFGTHVWRRGDDATIDYVLYNERLLGHYYMWLYPEDTCPPYYLNATERSLNYALADGSPVDWNYNGVIDDEPLSDYDINGHCRAVENEDGSVSCDCSQSTMMTLTSLNEIFYLKTRITGTSESILLGSTPSSSGLAAITDADSNPDDYEENDIVDGMGTDAEYCDGVDNDGDGRIDEGFADGDGDAIADVIDNCPFVPNADQSDMNGDGIGDACIAAPNAPTDLALETNEVTTLIWETNPQGGLLGYNIYRRLPGEIGMSRIGPAFPTSLEVGYDIECVTDGIYAVTAVDIYMNESPMSDGLLLTESGVCSTETVPADIGSCDDGLVCTEDEENLSSGNCTHTEIAGCVEPADTDTGEADTGEADTDTGEDSEWTTDISDTETDRLLDTATETTEADTETVADEDTETAAEIETDAEAETDTAVPSDSDTDDEANEDANDDADTETSEESNDTGHTANDSTGTGDGGCGCRVAGHRSVMEMFELVASLLFF